MFFGKKIGRSLIGRRIGGSGQLFKGRGKMRKSAALRPLQRAMAEG